jgi:hypothetical protein
MKNDKILKVLNGEEILYPEDCKNEAEFHDIRNLKAIIEDENEKIKPIAKVIGKDGNVFNLIGICGRALKQAGQREKISEMQSRIFSCGSYDNALSIMSEYCELI